MTTQEEWESTVCTMEGCVRPRHGVFHTWCRAHYERQRLERNKAKVPLGFAKGCDVEGCTRPHHATGLCRLHYNRKVTTGSLDLKPKAESVKPTCSVPGCSREAKSRGWCGSHYSNYRQHGVPVVAKTRGPRDEPLLDKFARHLTADDELGCWLYDGIINRDGYGKFYVGGKREVKAHRWLYQELTGKTLTRAVQLDHTCEVRHCVRPSHLLEVSQALHNAHTAARKSAPAGQWYKADESPRSLAEVAYAITHKLPMIWNQ